MLIHASLRCPDCGSSDALAEYVNGTFCFSCHKSHYFFGSKDTAFKKLKGKIEVPFETCGIKENSYIHCFLKERCFTEDMLRFYNIEQSTDDNYLVLTGYKDCKRQFIEIRLMNKNIQGPKYRTVGTKKLWYQGARSIHTNKLIVVEDMLSAMRVGWKYPCIALRGTSLSEEVTSKLCQFPKGTTIFTWFDSDKPGQTAAKAFKEKLNWAGFGFVNIVSEKDPKMYTEEEIDDILTLGGYQSVI